MEWATTAAPLMYIMVERASLEPSEQSHSTYIVTSFIHYRPTTTEMKNCFKTWFHFQVSKKLFYFTKEWPNSNLLYFNKLWWSFNILLLHKRVFLNRYGNEHVNFKKLCHLPHNLHHCMGGNFLLCTQFSLERNFSFLVFVV